MTTNFEADTMLSPGIQEALATIDKTLSRLAVRELVATTEVTDILLDIRSSLRPTAQ